MHVYVLTDDWGFCKSTKTRFALDSIDDLRDMRTPEELSKYLAWVSKNSRVLMPHRLSTSSSKFHTSRIFKSFVQCVLCIQVCIHVIWIKRCIPLMPVVYPYRSTALSSRFHVWTRVEFKDRSFFCVLCIYEPESLCVLCEQVPRVNMYRMYKTIV